MSEKAELLKLIKRQNVMLSKNKDVIEKQEKALSEFTNPKNWFSVRH